MKKPHSLAILMLCFAAAVVLSACKSAGTPREPDGSGTPSNGPARQSDSSAGQPDSAAKQPDSSTAGWRTAAAPQAPPRAIPAGQNVTVSRSRNTQTAARGRTRTVARVAQAPAQPRSTPVRTAEKTGELSRRAVEEIDPKRTILGAAAPVLFVGLVGAVTTGFDSRRRRPKRASPPRSR